MFKDNLLASSHCLTLPNSLLTTFSSSLILPASKYMLVSSAKRQKQSLGDELGKSFMKIKKAADQG